MRELPRTQPLLPGCSLRVKDIPCECTRFTRKLFDWDHLPRSVVWTHKGCVCNEKVALQLRHQVDDGSRFDLNYYKLFDNNMQKLVKQCKPITKYSVAMGYSGAKRELALRAIESLRNECLDFVSDSKVRMFLKDDKYHTGDRKAPRAINYRDKRYALTLAQYTYPIEHRLYNLRIDGVRTFAKGRNLVQRAADLAEMWDKYVDPCAWLLDHSKFDAHITVEHIKSAIKLNSNCYRDAKCRNKVRKLMRCQLINRGNTRNGTKFNTFATRMSGDQNTGLDNSTINRSIIRTVCDLLGITCHIYVDGDDSVVVMDRRDLKKTSVDLFSHFGMVTKEEFAFEFEHVEFCQTRPVWNGVEYVMVRNPERVLSRINWTVKKIPLCRDDVYLKSVFLCEAALNEGVPIFGSLAPRISKQFGKAKVMKVELDYFVNKLGKEKGKLYEREISYDSRLSFENAWGVSPEEQCFLEALTMLSPTDPYPDLLEMMPTSVDLVM